jgi:hypothetical protein
MIELLSLLGLNKYDTSRILPVKCYIDNFVCLQSCIRNINSCVLGHTGMGTMHHQVMVQTFGIVTWLGVYPVCPNTDGAKWCIINIQLHQRGHIR